jgi:molybdate transport system permease protein
MNELVRPLLFSILISTLATATVALAGIPLAHLLARRRFRGRELLEVVITLPLVLPPTVVGYLLIVLFGVRGLVGRLFHFTIVFRWYGAVVAAAVVALPLLVLPAKAAFASIDPDLADVARLAGAGRWRTFWYVSLPLASRGILAGLMLAFARSLGEFGATVMVLGDFSSMRTLPISIYDASQSGGLDSPAARASVAVLTGLSILVVLIYNRIPANRGM